MTPEVLLAAIGVPLAALWVAVGLARSRSRRFAIAVYAAWAVVSAGSVLAAVSYGDRRPAPPPDDRPIEVREGGYVSSDRCRSCHVREHATWAASFHSTMTTLASPETVKGAFDGKPRQFFDRIYVMTRRGNEYFVEMDDPDAPRGKPAPRIERRIEMITGSHHMQIYWYEGERSRVLGQFALIWLIDDQRWIPRDAAFLRPSQHVPGNEYGRWNLTCIRCHATHGQPRVDLEAMVQAGEVVDADTRAAEFGIACEACHGPSEAHVEINRNPKRRYELHLTGAPDETVVQPDDLRSDRTSQVCGQCHSISRHVEPSHYMVWNEKGLVYRPGDNLAEVIYPVRPAQTPMNADLKQQLGFDPAYLRDRFWSDGMVRVSGREYNGLVESPCYPPGGFTCTSCHQMHRSDDDPRPVDEWTDDQLKPGLETDQACLQCHEKYATDLKRHTRHAPESSGSRCYNCHMPHTTYGLLKAIRSHQIDSPTVAATLETGRPNACNACHLDRTLAWTDRYLEEWYGQPRHEVGFDHSQVAASLIWLLRGDAGQRALVAWHMGWGPALDASGRDWIAPALAQVLVDPYDAVRYVAGRSLRSLEGFEDVPYDFMGSEEEKQDARARVLARWDAMQRTLDTSSSAAVLVDRDGRLREDIVSILMAARDDRRVDLKE